MYDIIEPMKGQIVRDLRAGKVVTVPTETVEGYAVALNSESAVRELMRMKERGFDSGKVFTLVPESVEAIRNYVLVSPAARGLINKYIPGELTLILPKNPGFKHFYYDEFERRGIKIGIGIRIPNHPLFAEILPEVGALMLTSANPRGGTPRSLTGHRPSTVVDMTGAVPKILRQGDLKLDL